MPRLKSSRKQAAPAHRTLPAETDFAELPEWLERVRSTVEHEQPIMRVLMVRAINAVLKFAALSETAAVRASEAPTDQAVLLRALSSGEFLADLKNVEPLAPAFIRGIEAKRRLIEDNGGALTAEQVAESFGITRQAVEKRRRAGKLLALTTGRHGYRYPAWQFTDAGTIPGLEGVLGALASQDEWTQTAFFVGHNPRLGNRTPVEVLKAGDLESVLTAAEVYGEHGAA
jgi:hypothetical protein